MSRAAEMHAALTKAQPGGVVVVERYERSGVVKVCRESPDNCPHRSALDDPGSLRAGRAWDRQNELGAWTGPAAEIRGDLIAALVMAAGLKLEVLK